MKFIYDFLDFFSLFFNLTKEVFKQAPENQIYNITLKSAAKVLNTLAFFVPLKILILVGSDSYPGYLDFLSEYIHRSELIVFLLILLPVIFLVYLFVGYLSGSKIHASEVYVNENPMTLRGCVLTGKQSKWFYGHCSKGATELLIALSGCIVMLLLSIPFFSCLIVLLLVFCMITRESFFKYNKDGRDQIYNLPISSFVEYVFIVLYVMLFFLIALFLWISKIGIYEAVLSILVVKMIVQSVQRMMVEIYFINKDSNNLGLIITVKD